MKSISVVGAAVIRDGLILAAKRGEKMSLPGKWEFPGGKVEPGETREQSLIRELNEELGIDVRVEQFVARGVVETADLRVELDVFICSITQGEPRAHEHAELRWLESAQLSDLEWAEADLPAVCALVEGGSLF